MDVNQVNPFVEAFNGVMPLLGFSTVTRGKLSLKGKELITSGVVIVVGIVGDIKGNIVYEITLDNAKKIASKMMMGMPVEELDDMSQSALSELTNMLTANSATSFSNTGVIIDISTPTLLFGNNLSIKMSSSQVICVELFADEIPILINISIDK